jgi:subtilisin family serine protease
MKKELSLVLIGILVLSVYVPVTAPEGESVSVIFETSDKGALRNVVEAAGGTVTAEYVTVDMIAADVPLLAMESVLESPHVLHTYKDYMQHIPDFPQVPAGDSDDFAAQEVLNTSEFFHGFYWLEDLRDLPDTFYNYIITGAEDVWYETGAGDNTLTAVIDTGIYRYHPLLMYPDGTSRVIGGISFAPGEDPNSWGDPDNHYHGTVCAGLVGANGGILLPETGYLAQSFMLYAPDSYFEHDPDTIFVPLLGTSPLCEFYSIKVFPKSGAGVPSSVIMQGIDHAIYMRQLYDATGGAQGYPIDVISMSLGGGTGYDGQDPEDRLVDEATKTGIVVVAAAGNDGPGFNTVSTPGCANTSISVGAAADPVHTRVGWDITYGMAGIGEYFYPYDDVQIIYFSSRGPTSDGRFVPDVLACGVYALSAFPPASIGIMSGTSSACPAVAGGAALLVNWQKMNEGAANPYQIRNAIIEGGVLLDLPYHEYAQGNGYFNVVNSLYLLQSGIDGGLHLDSSYSIDAVDLKGGSQTWSTGDLLPGVPYSIAIAVDEDTQRLEVCLSNVTLPGPQNPLMGDSIEFYIQSAVRTAEYTYYYSINLYGDACFTVDEPNPGIVKIDIEPDWTNWGGASCDVTVTETEGRESYGGHKQTIGHDEWAVHYVDVPEGLAAVIFELWWMHNWSKFPTYDLDMYVIDPDGTLYLDGAQFWSPEKQVITNPVPGTYTVYVYGYEIYHGRDPYWLNVFYIT